VSAHSFGDDDPATAGTPRPVVEPRAATREHIVQATYELMQESGLVGLTTRSIAERAGCAEGSIYRYFADKHALVAEVVVTRLGSFLKLITALPDRAGTGTVRRNLQELAEQAIDFFSGILPLVVAALSDQELLAGLRTHWHDAGVGPARTRMQVAEYLRREQRLNRIDRTVSADHLAALLLGACFAQAMMTELVGKEGTWSRDRFAGTIVRTLLTGAAPKEPPQPDATA
jgi:AcrR family transcriptional regulator